MKNLIVSVFLLAFAVNTFASAVEWREIESKKCDTNAAVAVQNESVAIMKDQAMIAFKKKDADGCNFADFYSILMIASGQTNGKSFAVFQPAQAISRKNCRNELSPAPAAFFTMVQSSDESVILSGAEGCEALELKLKAKAPAPVQ